MTDIASIEKRSQMMSGIRSKNTKPEIIIRSALHRKGLRYRIHVKSLPGSPDIVLKKFKAVIFVNGCFWHGHPCHLFKIPSSKIEFWKNKIYRNKDIDTKSIESLLKLGWKVCLIWECAIKGKTKLDFQTLIDSCVEWIYSGNGMLQITGNK